MRHSGAGSRCLATMTTLWLFAVCSFISLGEHVSASSLCTYRITDIFVYTESRYCDYGCCQKDCCTYQDYKTATYQIWTYVGICVGVAFMVILIASVVIYFYRRHRLRQRVIQYGRFGNPGNALTVTTTNHI